MFVSDLEETMYLRKFVKLFGIKTFCSRLLYLLWSFDAHCLNVVYEGKIDLEFFLYRNVDAYLSDFTVSSHSVWNCQNQKQNENKRDLYSCYL